MHRRQPSTHLKHHPPPLPDAPRTAENPPSSFRRLHLPFLLPSSHRKSASLLKNLVPSRLRHQENAVTDDQNNDNRFHHVNDTTSPSFRAGCIPKEKMTLGHVDPHDDPDIGEIVLVKRRKNRASLKQVQWTSPSNQSTRVQDATQDHEPKRDLKAGGMTPTPLVHRDSAPPARRSSKVSPGVIHLPDPDTFPLPHAQASPSTAPSANGGSLALRAIRSVRSLAKIASLSSVAAAPKSAKREKPGLPQGESVPPAPASRGSLAIRAIRSIRSMRSLGKVASHAALSGEVTSRPGRDRKAIARETNKVALASRGDRATVPPHGGDALKKTALVGRPIGLTPARRRFPAPRRTAETPTRHTTPVVEGAVTAGPHHRSLVSESESVGLGKMSRQIGDSPSTNASEGQEKSEDTRKEIEGGSHARRGTSPIRSLSEAQAPSNGTSQSGIEDSRPTSSSEPTHQRCGSTPTQVNAAASELRRPDLVPLVAPPSNAKPLPSGGQTDEHSLEPENPINTLAPPMTPQSSPGKVFSVSLRARSGLTAVNSHIRDPTLIRPQDLIDLKDAIHFATRETREHSMAIICVSLAMQQPLSLYSPLSGVLGAVLPVPAAAPLVPGSCMSIVRSRALPTTTRPLLAFVDVQDIQPPSGSPRRVTSRTLVVLKKWNPVKPCPDVLGGLLLLCADKERPPTVASGPHVEPLGQLHLAASLVPRFRIQPFLLWGDFAFMDRLLTANQGGILDGKALVLHVEKAFKTSGSIAWRGSDSTPPLISPILSSSSPNRHGHRRERVGRDALSSYACTPTSSHRPCEDSGMAILRISPAPQSSLSYSENSLAPSRTMAAVPHWSVASASKDLSQSPSAQPHSDRKTLQPAPEAEHSSKQLRPLLPPPSSIDPFSVAKHKDTASVFAWPVVSNRSKAKSVFTCARRHVLSSSCTQTYGYHTEGDTMATICCGRRARRYSYPHVECLCRNSMGRQGTPSQIPKRRLDPASPKERHTVQLQEPELLRHHSEGVWGGDLNSILFTHIPLSQEHSQPESRRASMSDPNRSRPSFGRTYGHPDTSRLIVDADGIPSDVASQSVSTSQIDVQAQLYVNGRRISHRKLKRSDTSVSDTIKENDAAPPPYFVENNSRTTRRPSLFDTGKVPVYPSANVFRDDEENSLTWRRYHALKNEAEDTVTESRRLWEDTPVSIFAVQCFDPPRQRAGMWAILDHSIEIYRPLPSCFRRHGRSRTHSRPTPYPLVSPVPHSCSMQHVSFAFDLSTLPEKNGASLMHTSTRSRVQSVCSQTYSHGLSSTQPLQGHLGKRLTTVKAPLQPVRINANGNARDSSLEPKKRPSLFATDQKPHLPSSAHQPSVPGLSKRQTIQSSTSHAKENVLSSHGQDTSTQLQSLKIRAQ